MCKDSRSHQKSQKHPRSSWMGLQGGCAHCSINGGGIDTKSRARATFMGWLRVPFILTASIAKECLNQNPARIVDFSVLSNPSCQTGRGFGTPCALPVVFTCARSIGRPKDGTRSMQMLLLRRILPALAAMLRFAKALEREAIVMENLPSAIHGHGYGRPRRQLSDPANLTDRRRP